VSRDPIADRILVRRARFVALALAAVACHEGEAAPSNQTVQLPPPEDAGTTATAADAGETHVAVIDAGHAAPSGISPETKERYVRLRAQVDTLRDRIAQTTEKVAKAPAFSTATSATWTDLVVEIQTYYQAIGYMSIYCPKPRPETDEFLAFVNEQQTALHALVDALKKTADARLTDKTMTGAARFDLLRQQHNNANPKPCLSIACDSW
jgi:cytochrome c peroxidase